MRPFLRYVEDGCAVDGDVGVAKFLSDQPGAGEGRLLRHFGIGLVEDAIAAGGRHVPPVGRAEPLHAAPFLVDEHEHVVALDRILERGDERAQLLRRRAIACEQDEAARPRVVKEAPLGVAER
jgi:hypothetical protein